MAHISVFICDDHRILVQGLRELLAAEAGFDVIGEANAGRDALGVVPRLEPDVMLLDVRMPDINGVAVAARLTAVAPRVRIIGLSVQVDGMVVQEFLAAGAMGFVAKSSAGTELVRAIRVVARQGRCYLCPEATSALVATLRRRPQEERPLDGLNRRECAVLRSLAAGESSKEIALRLNIAVGTVEVHRRNIMRKLNTHNVADLTKYAIKHGLATL